MAHRDAGGGAVHSIKNGHSSLAVSPASDLRWKLHDEGRAFPYDALGPNPPPHHFREPLRQSETETGPAEMPGGGFVSL